MINGRGITGHGPAWQRVRGAAQDTVNLYLDGFYETFLLSCASEPEVRHEAGARLRKLEGLYKKVKREDNKTEQEKKTERNKKRATVRTNTRQRLCGSPFCMGIARWQYRCKNREGKLKLKCKD